MSSVFLRRWAYNELKYQVDQLPGDEIREDKMKKLITVVLVTIQCSFISMAMAASDKCVVVKSEGNELTLECRKETDRFQPGTEVKIKSNSKAAVEGC